MSYKIFTYLIFFLISFCIQGCISSCFFDGEVYAEEKTWNSSCNICSCRSNTVSCTKIVCPAISCPPGESSLHHPSECCSQCLPYKKPCVIESVTYLHNDVWSFTSKCIFYQCQDGLSVPFVIMCPSLVCAEDETPFTAPGECCPQCTSSEKQKKNITDESIPESFQNISSIHNCDNKTDIKENLLWKNQCTFCVSEKNGMNCYYQKCSGCSSQASNNDSCCPCFFDTCAEDCLRCLDNDTNYCTHCKNSSKMIHNGKCVEECPKSFFKDEILHCRSCPPNCRSCFGNMSSQCTSCKSGYLLQRGHCVKSCDVNFYEFNGYCFECHASCSSCIGPSEEDCIACTISGQLLQDGKCVDDCDGHFYVSDDGYCLSCNESCIRCLKNGSCQYCEKGFYLQDGVCLAECYPGYYLFLDAYCLPCHEECQECFGPLPYQCTSCPFNQYLLKNSCVDACGQGYYGDLGAGLCRPCHPECRNCLDTSSDDKCLSCSNGYLLPYIGTHFGSCVHNCPEQYYLMESGICDTCHETCKSCFGPNDTECTSCNNTLYFKNGACVPHCSIGYYENSGLCYACHPSCATCHDFTENDCYTCPPGRKLKSGKCIPVCIEGKYMDLDGLCTDCHPSCSDCMLSSSDDKTIQCIKCKNPRYNIYKDECIPQCSSDFYLNPYRTCTDCHASCATCEEIGATNCASCRDGNFLTHLRTCEPQCYKGYFSSDGVCESCSADCHECISATECLKCKGDLVLQFGKCVSGCSEQFYLDTVTRQCKECSSECNSCRGPLSSDCLSCVHGKLFEDGICVDHCSVGFFQDGNICKTCDLQCETCSSLNNCTSCKLPYFLLKNECVDDCGAGFYSNFETQICKACGVGCLSCVSPDYCALCFTGFYLLNFECISQCPPEYYGDPLWRTCQKNVDVPSLHIHSILRIQPERRVLISASFLSASDADSDFLLINVSHLPRNGFLLKMSESGEEIQLNVGENFTFTQLKDGWIFFKHLKGIPLNGDIVLTVTDGQLTGDKVNLPLLVFSKFPPVVKQTKNIVLTEESSVVLNTSYFSVNDPDNLNDVTLQLLESPCSGKLVLLPDEREVTTISYEEFLQNKLLLKTFKKPLRQDDKFIIQISDGFNSVIAEIEIFVIPKEQKQLFILRNNPLLVKFDELTELTNHHLYAIGEETSSNEMIFSLEKSSLDMHGYFFKSINNSKKKKKMSSSIISFTQEDVDQELISYKHSDNSTSNIIIHLKVTNTKSKAELDFNFEIKVIKFDDIIVPEETNQFGIMVLQNHPATITNDHLQMHLNGISTGDIVYMITKKLAKEEGFLESLDKPGYRLQSFSQKDIDDLKIVYHPPPYLEATETNYIFQFIVLDSRRRIQLSPVQNFTITVRPQSTEYTSPSSSIDHIATIVVPQGQSIELGSHWLSTVGHEIPDDQLEVVLNIAPRHGNLSQIQNGYEIKIEEEDGFSFTSIIRDTYYTHDGSNNFKDYAVFKIMGGPYSSLNKIDFMISPSDKESPVILDSTSLMGSVTEGKYLDIKRHHLAYTDLVSGDQDIIFTLLNKPTSGNLSKLITGNYLTLELGDTFTQQDINDHLIRFIAHDAIGNNTVRENLYFDVSDGSGNVQRNQPLLMKVKPKVREPPVVKVLSDVKVNEGGEAVIEPYVITVFDPDSPLSDLIAYIDKQPDYGFLENSRPIPGAEKSLAGIPISSFSYIDLVEGYIKYIQITHRDMEPERDTVYIRISDGFLSSPAHLVNITIKPTNDETPLVHAQHLSVLQGSFAKITNSSLSVTDGDTSADQLYIRLDNPPHKGGIRLLASNTYNLKSSKAVLKQDTFTFQDVLDGLIMYVHEDFKSPENDTFSFTISDGHHIVSDSIDVFIIVRDREVPYLVRNLGLELLPGESSIIGNKILSAMDSDSSIQLLKYVLTSDPSSGELFLMQNGKAEKISHLYKSKGMNYFSQTDVDTGRVFYRHFTGNPIGMHYFKFNIEDPANNTLLDQKFFISIFEDLFPPVITANSGLEVEEKKHSCINSSMLAAIDEHQKNKNLIFTLTSLPIYGYLTMKSDTEKPITSFFMTDLNAGHVCYVHKSDKYSLKDSFIFTVTDGKNYILQTFHINITFTTNTMPFIKIYPLLLDEGTQKIISEFEIDIFDRDSADSEIIIFVISPPKHGKITDSDGLSINKFSFEDIKHNHISYFHDNTDTTMDNFTILVSDGSNSEFLISEKYGKNVSTKDPVELPIKIFSVDDIHPVLLKNEGLQVLKKESGKIWNTISENILHTGDSDTEKEHIVYHITLQPRFGSLELASKPNTKVLQFTQKNIKDEELLYVLKTDDFMTTEDRFIFSVEDTKPNKIFNNIFVVHWARIHFLSSVYNISEISGLLELPVRRTGNKNLDFIASCKIESIGSQKIHDHLVAVIDEIHFKENDGTKFCIFRIIDNKSFEGKKEFKVILSSNNSLLASPRATVISITDTEDEPSLSFNEGIFKVNETDEYFDFPIIRKGDLNLELSVFCNTSNLTAVGSNATSLQTGIDYRSRDSSYRNFITFNPGVSEMMCSVKIIDDNLFEDEEEFLLVLSEPQPIGKIQNHSKAHVVIQGPNDVPYVFIQEKKYEMFYGDQNSSVILVRQGVDISKICTVWCGSQLLTSSKTEELTNSYYQLTFEPFETSVVCFVRTDSLKQKASNIDDMMQIFIDSPTGCLISEPSKISVPLKKKIIHPIVEFKVSHMIIQENAGLVNIPVQRSGDISSSATLYCITQDGTAVARDDYEERYNTRRNSLIHFSPGQKELFCSLNIYDDDMYEGNESFQVFLSPLERENEIVTIGLKKSVTVDIIDSEDITVIELEKAHYLVTQSSFPNSSTSAVLSVLRYGDTSLLSKVRISTIDGSASSGLDYYAKSKLFSFLPDETKKNFEIEILYNKRRNWALAFTVILGPDEVMNAEIGNRSKSIVTIPRVESTESLILPSVPVVVSLIYYDDIKKGLTQDAKSGYSLICITPCDVNYPDYAVTSALCRESRINISSLSYSWEIAMPLSTEDSFSPFEKITDSPLFISAYGKKISWSSLSLAEQNQKRAEFAKQKFRVSVAILYHLLMEVLDSIYFRPHERVRCVVQPVDSKGHLGISLRSKSIRISSESGFCLTSNKIQYPSASLSSQPFIASLSYINSSDIHHPNKLHIHIEISHEDGLLPLISTYPLHNVEFLLMHNVYRQQHVCSNLLQTVQKSFLKSLHPQLKDVKSAFPYHAEQMPKEMWLIYQHLDLKKCKWSFDAWYSMSDLVDLCGGSVISDFKARDLDKTYVSVLLPLYVTYIFAAAPTGWTSVEHRTEIEFSFFYNTFLWKEGSHADNFFNASLSIVRIGTDSSGHLFFEFKTVAKFYGCFVLEHHTLPGIKSHLTVPNGLDVKFNLKLLWSEQTFDGPTQFWKATSNYNLKDYSGRYTVHLIPCEASHSEHFSVLTEIQYLPCIAQVPQKFELPITFQQTLRPEPVTYALETFFQLFNDKNLFLLNPFEKYPNFQYIEYKGAFSKGENVYGRVFWSPEQELESAYQLKIKEVMLCAGKNGFVPLYDPTGKIYGKGPQYGCLIPNKNLRHKFILLDRHNLDVSHGASQEWPFNAAFIEDSWEYEKLSQVPGVDGFVFNTEPLYEVSSSHQWFLQVTYCIKPTQTSRISRSLQSTEIAWKEENLTSIKMLVLGMNDIKHSFLQSVKESKVQMGFGAHHIMYLISAILIILGILIIIYKNPKLTKENSSKVLKKYMWMHFNSKALDNNSKCYSIVECKRKLKKSEKCKIRIYEPKKKVYFPNNSTETEV